jgi:flagellin
MSDIVLSAGIRSNLLALQNTASNIQKVQTSLATGLKVNSALDSPIAYFTASSLNALAGNLGNLLDSVSNAVQTVQAANNGITSTGNVTVNQIINAVNGAAGLKIQAELSANGNLQLEATGANVITVGGTATAAELAQFGFTAGTTAAGSVNATRSSLATQYNALLKQIDQLASDAGFNGVNLLAGNSLQVTFNAAGTSSLVLQGVTFNSAGLGIGQSQSSFQTNTSIAGAQGQLTAALGTLQSQAASFGTNLSVIQIRQSFTTATINTLQTGANNLTVADSNLEGANLLALQTRQSLATTALSLAAQSQNSVLRLFG